MIKVSFLKRLNIIFLLVFIFFVSIFIQTSEAKKIVDRIVAIVNNDVITLHELNQGLSLYAEKIKSMGYPKEKERKMLFKVRENLLNQLIEKKITDQEVKKANITANEKDIDNALEHFKKQNYLTDEQLRAGLAKEGLSLNSYRDTIKEQLLRAKLVGLKVSSTIVITDEDLEKYYKKTYGKPKKQTKVFLRNIILKIPTYATEQEKQIIKTKMENILKQLKDGKTFADMAKKYSESSFAQDGGKLGFFNFKDLSPLLQENLKGLKQGDFTNILDTKQGYQIFYLQEEKQVQTNTLAELKDKITKKLYNEKVEAKYQTWLKKLKKDSHIKIIQ